MTVLTELTTRETPEFRKPVLTRVEASWQGASETWQNIAARMEDKSAGGACIRARAPIKAGTNVRIESRLDDFSGMVRYCSADGKQFLIGIQCDSPETVAPSRPGDTLIAPQSDTAQAQRPRNARKARRAQFAQSSPSCSLNRREREQRSSRTDRECNHGAGARCGSRAKMV